MKKYKIEHWLNRVKWERYSLNLNLFKSVSAEVDTFLDKKDIKSLHLDFFLDKDMNQNVYEQTYDEDRKRPLVDTVTLPLLYSDVTDPVLIRKYLTAAAALVAPHGTVLIPNYGTIDPEMLGDIFLNANTVSTKTVKLTRCTRPRKYDLDPGLIAEIIQDLGIHAEPDTFIKRPSLLPHQVDAFNFWHSRGRRALWALDMGTGKSYAERYILYKNMFSGTYKHIAVMTIASVIPAWIYELEKLKVPVRYWKNKDDADHMRPGVINIMSLESIQYASGPKQDAYSTPEEYKLAQKRWNAQPFLKKISRKFYPGMFELIIVDESHKLNAHTNIATKLLNVVATPDTHLLFSTGTPFSNGLHESFSQMNLLRPGILGPNITHFQNNCCENVSKNPKFRKWQLRAHLTDQITNIIYSVAKFQKIVDGITLPLLTVTDIEYRLSEEQLTFQNKIRNDHVIPITTDKLPNGVPIVNASRAAVSLQTLCSGFINFDFEFPGLPVTEHIEHIFSSNPKLEQFTELILGLRDAQALIWIKSLRTGAMLRDYLTNMGYTVELVNSTVSKAARQPIIRKFLDNKIQFVVAHPQTLGTGLDFLNATYQIFYELTYSLTEYGQAQKRSHRIGQRNNVIIYRLIGKNSIEKSIGYALEKKIQVESYLFSEYLNSYQKEDIKEIAEEETHVEPDRDIGSPPGGFDIIY